MICMAIALLANPAAHAALDELTTIERGIAQPHIQALFDAQLDYAKGEQQAAGRWENPEVEYSQEHLDLLSGRSEETTWWLRQKLNIAGTKGMERDAAAAALQAAEAQVALRRRQLQAQIREQFYAALAAQIQADSLANHHDRLQRIATFIEQRVAQGDASRYDSLRIAQELARAQSAYAQSRAEQQAEHHKLFSLVGGEPATLSGELLPPAAHINEVSFQQSLGQGLHEQHSLKQHLLEHHPQLQMLAALERSASLSARAARREAWPEVSIGVGRKTLDEPGFSAEGDAVALSVEIPLFDRSRGKVRRADALAHEYAADYTSTRNRLNAQLQTLLTTLAAQHGSAEALRQVSTAGENSLSTIAEASYQAGELSIMELVDAYRTELDTWQRYIDSARAARITFIQIQQLEGK